MATYTSLNVIFGRAFLNTVVAAWKTTSSGPLIASPKVRLAINPAFLPTPSSTISDLATDEADFSGYPSGGSSITLGAAVNLGVNIQGCVQPASFIASTGTPFVSNTVYGYWLDDGTNVILAEAFPPGISFTFGSPGDFLELVVAIPANAIQAAQ
jgi:hypothetical protein